MERRHGTELEIMLLDELRHVLLVHKNRMITSQNYIQFMGEMQAAITKAEKEIES